MSEFGEVVHRLADLSEGNYVLIRVGKIDRLSTPGDRVRSWKVNARLRHREITGSGVTLIEAARAALAILEGEMPLRQTEGQGGAS